ncbi:MAG: ATP-binding protein [Aggregatilineales bacterium]
MATEFLARVAEQGAIVLYGRAFETDSQLPYQSLIDAVRDCVEREVDVRQLLSDTWLAELSRLLPELHERIADLPAPLILGEAEARTRLFEAITRLGYSLTRRAPTVLFLDDLQWADPATLDLLQYAVQRWRTLNLPILLILAARSEDLDIPRLPNPLTLRDRLRALGQEIAPAHQLVLGPLNFDATRQLVEALRFDVADYTDQTLEQFSQKLFAETGGQPFYIVQTLKALTDRGQFDQEKTTGVGEPTPHGIAALVQSRLARLSLNGLNLCAAGAVLGNVFTFEPLLHVADLSEREGLLALDETLMRGLFRESDHRLFFTHDRIREMAYAKLNATRKQVFHRRALEALGARSAAPSELARHALLAGLEARAFHLNVAAGDEALRVFALGNAIAHYEQSRTLLQEQPEGSIWQAHISADEEQYLFLKLGHACELASRWDRAGAAYQAALDLARSMKQSHDECVALNRLATLAAQSRFDLGGATVLLQAAQSLAESAGDKVGQIETESNLAQINFYRWNLPAALEHAHHALALAREMGQGEVIARSLNVLAYISMPSGRSMEEVKALADESRSLYAALGNRAMEADNLSVVCCAAVHRGLLPLAISAGQEGLDISATIENDWGYANNASWLAFSRLAAGEFAQALEVAQAGVSKARGGHPPTVIFNLLALGGVYRALLVPDAALPFHLEAKAIAERLHNPYLAEWVAAELCADYAMAANWTEAYEYAAQVQSLHRDLEAPSTLTYCHDIDAFLLSGAVETAIEALQRLEAQVAKFDDIGLGYLAYLRSAAALARWQGENERTIAYLREATARAKTWGMPGELWQIEAALGDIYLACGDAGQAHLSFVLATETIHTLAAGVQSAELRATFIKEASKRISSG